MIHITSARPIFDPSRPLLRFRSILWKPLGYINLTTAVLIRGDKYFLTSLDWRVVVMIVALFHKTTTIFTLCVD